jgi:hypothetical protein
MDGCKIVAISGIDGIFTDFTNLVENGISCKDCLKISYERSLTFLQNIEVMRSIIDKIDKECYLIGWSIGAVAATFLADCTNVKVVILINPFFKRSEILKRRNKFCDEEVCIESTIVQPVKYVVIAGLQDDKIPCSESRKIAEYFNIDNNQIYFIDNAKHSLDTFPEGRISDIINKYIL